MNATTTDTTSPATTAGTTPAGLLTGHELAEQLGWQLRYRRVMTERPDHASVLAPSADEGGRWRPLRAFDGPTAEWEARDSGRGRD